MLEPSDGTSPPWGEATDDSSSAAQGRWWQALLQLLSEHAAIGPHIKGKTHKFDDDKCWWCEGGERQSRHYLFARCRAWAL